jgi:hypothetical protein
VTPSPSLVDAAESGDPLRLAGELATQRARIDALEGRVGKLERPWLLFAANASAALTFLGAMIAHHLLGGR